MSARCRRRGGGSTFGSGTSGREGRSSKIATGSIVAAIVGAAIKDLSRPNSLIRGLITLGREKLLARRESKSVIDISRAVKVEIIDEDKTGRDTNDVKKNEQEV